MGAVQVRRVQCRAPRSARVVDCRADVHISTAISPRGPYADQCGCMSVPAELPALILRSLALADGYDDKEIARNRRSGLWSSVRRGAYVGSASAEGLTRRARHGLLIRATVTKLRRPAVVSHVSAAVLHGLPLWSVPLTAVHVTRNPAAKSDSDRNLICHVCRLDPDEVTVVDGVAVTSPTRTVLDLGRLIGFTPAVIAADEALHRGLTSPELLSSSLENMHGTRGSRNAARVVNFADGRSESVGESRSRVLLAESGLPTPDLQVPVYAEDGFFLGRGDFGYAEEKMIGEFDGQVKYGRLLRPGQSAGESVFEEKRREDAIRDAGWQVARWTWPDLDVDGLVAARVQRALARSRSS